jgi:hypothetical protein
LPDILFGRIDSLAVRSVATNLPSANLAAFLRGDFPFLYSDIDGHLRIEAQDPGLLLPGSFNPVHEGHWGLAAVAERLTGQKAAFELSVTNVDKPSLPSEEVQRRLLQFLGRAPVWLTRAPTFEEKARLFPGTIFVVGADTAERLLELRYYQHSSQTVAEAFNSIRRQGCRFLVAGREDAFGKFIRLENIAVPEAFRDLFMEIPEAEFRFEASSTRLRDQARE